MTNETELGEFYELEPPKPDNELSQKLNFMCKQYIRGEVFGITTGKPIKEKSGLKPQMTVDCPSLFGRGKATVSEITGDKATGYSPSGKTVYFFEFSKDDRECWVCTGSGNMEGIKRVKFV